MNDPKQTPYITRRQALKQGLVEHLIPTIGTERIDTQFGFVPYQHYCSYEGQRIATAPGRTVAVVDDDGLFSLWVNPVARNAMN